MSSRKQVLDRLDTCGPGKIRNPRTDRCVRRDQPLGRALHAAAEALRAGTRLPACAPAGQAYDPAAKGCTSDRYRAPALRDLMTRYAWAAAANNSGRTSAKNSAALSRLIASQALAKAAAANNRRSHAANLGEAGAIIEGLAAYSGGLRERADSNAQNLLDVRKALDAALIELEACRRNLEAERSKTLDIVSALVNERG